MIFAQDIAEDRVLATDAPDPEITAALAGLPDATLAFLHNVASASPYLRGLILSQKDWLCVQITELSDPLAQDLLAQTDATGPQDLDADLRGLKAKVALLSALCDLSGQWSTAKVTRFLSDFASCAVQRATKLAIEKQFADGDLVNLRVHPFAGLFVLGMGKLGAGELNYSSDIDLIVFFQDDQFPPQDRPEIRAKLIKATQQMVKTISARTAHGYVFRTDLRLRPNPSVTPVCIATTAAKEYYAREARTWERSAFIKARPIAGDLDAGAAFLAHLEGFIWRRHLDFAAIKEIEDIQSQIRTHKAIGTARDLRGYDIKLGYGGIREIEFLTQTRQLLSGGRAKELRHSGTTQALDALAGTEWLSESAAKSLIANYYRLRDIEHRIQMLHDAQTHKIPQSEADLDRLARLCGAKSLADFEADLRALLDQTHQLSQLDMTREVSDDQTARQEGRFAHWQDLAALRNPQTKEIFDRLAPLIADHIKNAEDPTEMEENFGFFLERISRGLQLFSLFEVRHDILLTVMDICATSRKLAEKTAQEMRVLDGLAFEKNFAVLPDLATYHEMAMHFLRGIADYEDALNALRRWQSEQHFLIVIQELRGAVPLAQGERAFSDLAQACLQIVLTLCEDELARRFGVVPEARLGILAMGKLGSQEMTATSDLDLIVVFDGPPEGTSNGPKSLDLRSYYARLTKLLIAALSVPMTDGTLYEVDMRLRPSGRKGPVATSLTSFESYQRNEAWVWEHLALSRARVVAGAPELAAKIESIRQEVVLRARDRGLVCQELVAMRSRLASADPSPEPFSVKKGRGGMLELELFAQSLALILQCNERSPGDQLARACAGQLIDQDAFDFCLSALHQLKKIEHGKRLILADNAAIAGLSGRGRRFFIDFCGAKSLQDMEVQIVQMRKALDRIITAGIEALGRAA